VILAKEVGKSRLEGIDSRTLAFSIEIQQARCRNREAKTEKQKGGEWELYYQKQGSLPKWVVQYGIRDLANEKKSTKPPYPDTLGKGQRF
jgi:hypothetical protein